MRVGLYEGAVDGKLGPLSRAAICAFQKGAEWLPTAVPARVAWKP